MVGVGIIARPEELVLPDVGHQPGDRALVRIRRDEALPLEVVRRLLGQAHGGAQRRAGEGRIRAIEEVADPARLGLEHHDPQAREALEDAELEEGGEGLLHALSGEEIEVPDRPAELVEAVVDVERERLERRMHRQWNVEILGRREDRIVARVAVGHARDGEGTDEGAAAAVLHRALELAGGLGRIAEREMGDGDQPPAGVAAEVGDPAVVRAAVRARELGIEQLGFPQEAQGGVEHRLGEPLAVEELDALLHVHGAERRAPEVGLVRRGTDSPHVLGCDVPAHRLLAERPRLVDLLAHPAEGAQLTPAGDRGGPAVDLQVLEAVVAHADAECPLPVGGLEIGLPQIRWLQDVPVAVDYRRLDRHRVLSQGARASGLPAGRSARHSIQAAARRREPNRRRRGECCG